MYAETYTTRIGTTQYRPVLDNMQEMNELDTTGFCLACGADAPGVEPDARRYVCEACGQPKVFGLEELAIIGLLKFEGD